MLTKLLFGAILLAGTLLAVPLTPPRPTVPPLPTDKAEHAAVSQTPEPRYEARYVPAWGTATLTVQPTQPGSRLIWQTAPLWNQNYFITLFDDNVRVTYDPRASTLSEDGRTLFLDNMQPLDERYIRVLEKFPDPTNSTNSTSFQLALYRIYVMQSPVLRPVRAEQTSNKSPFIILLCYNMQSDINWPGYLTFEPSHPQGVSITPVRTFLEHVLEAKLTFQNNLLCPPQINVRCCVDLDNVTNACSKPTFLNIGRFVSRSAVGSRKTCPEQVLSSKAPSTIRNPMPNGHCDDTDRREELVYRWTRTWCPGSRARLEADSGLLTNISRLAFQYGPGQVLSTNDSRRTVYPTGVELASIHPKDSGYYQYSHAFTRSKDRVHGHDFVVDVEPFLRASLHLVAWKDDNIVLRCDSSLRYPYQYTQYSWDIALQGHTYEVSGDTLTIYPDCWNGRTLKFSFSVRCHVATDIWFTSSNWFTADFHERLPTIYTPQMCQAQSFKPTAGSDEFGVGQNTEL